MRYLMQYHENNYQLVLYIDINLFCNNAPQQVLPVQSLQ